MSDLSDRMYQASQPGWEANTSYGTPKKKKKTEEEEAKSRNVLKDYFYSQLGFEAGTDPGDALRTQLFGAMLGTDTTAATDATTVKDQVASELGTGDATDPGAALQSYFLGSSEDDTRNARVSIIKSLLGLGS
jgi:hypothetical protein